jgi:PHD/YefM family antitoxin component YafN of YafNO toxin-antitoxin module
MIELKERFVVDEQGKRVAVILDIEEYNRLLEWIEEQEDARAVNEALASGEKGIPLEEVITQIERGAE